MVSGVKHGTIRQTASDLYSADSIYYIDDEGKMIFPRYHQLRAVLRGEKDVAENGVGLQKG